MRVVIWPTSLQKLWCQMKCRKMCAIKMALGSGHMLTCWGAYQHKWKSASGTEWRRFNLRCGKVQGSPVKNKVTDQVVDLKDKWSLFACMLIFLVDHAWGQLKGGHRPAWVRVLPTSLIYGEWATSTKHRQEQAVGNTWGTAKQKWRWLATRHCYKRYRPSATKEDDCYWWNGSCQSTPWAKACAQWAQHFIPTLYRKCSNYNEVHPVFDHYDLLNSLKETTRER